MGGEVTLTALTQGLVSRYLQTSILNYPEKLFFKKILIISVRNYLK